MQNPIMRSRSHHPDPEAQPVPAALRWLAAAAGAAAGALALWRWYLPAMAPTILHGDMAEFQYLAWKPGITHGTGFPVYIWLGHLMTYLPLREIAWRVTLVSGLVAAGTLLFLVLAFLEAPGPSGRPGLLAWHRWLAAGLGAGALAYSFMFWRHAIVSEVYTLHLCFMALVLWLAVRWSREQSERVLLTGAFLWAFSWGNHMMATVLGPPLALFCLTHAPRRWLDGRRLLKVAGCCAAGLAAVLFLFWLLWRRDLPQDHIHTNIGPAIDMYHVGPGRWPSFWRQWWFIQSGEQFYKLMLTAPAEWKRLQWSLLPYRVLGEFFPVGVAVAGLGWLLLWWRRWRLNLLLTGIVLTQMVMSANYYMTWEIYAYYMPIYLCIAWWLAEGAAGLLGGVRAAVEGLWRRPSARRSAVAVLLCLAAAAGLTWGSLRSREQAQRWAASLPKEQREVLHTLGGRPNFAKERWGERQAAIILYECGGAPCLYIGPFTLQYTLFYLAETAWDLPYFMAYEMHPLAPKEGLSASRLRLIEENLPDKTVLLGYRTPEIDRKYVVRRIASSPELWRVEGWR